MKPSNQQNATWPNVSPDVADLVEEAANLCRAIAAKDLAGLPLYIVPQSAVQATLGAAEACYGYHANALDILLRDDIGAAWQGRGPCLVLNDVAMKEDCGSDIRDQFLTTAVHELAHILEQNELGYGEPGIDFTPNRVLFERFRLAYQMARPIPVEQQPKKFIFHSERFYRVALHLHHRANEAGEWLQRGLLFPDEGLIWNSREYKQALGNEPDHLMNETFKTILSMAPPLKFAAMWQAEMHHQSEKEIPQ